MNTAMLSQAYRCTGEMIVTRLKATYYAPEDYILSLSERYRTGVCYRANVCSKSFISFHQRRRRGLTQTGYAGSRRKGVVNVYMLVKDAGASAVPWQRRVRHIEKMLVFFSLGDISRKSKHAPSLMPLFATIHPRRRPTTFTPC